MSESVIRRAAQAIVDYYRTHRQIGHSRAQAEGWNRGQRVTVVARNASQAHLLASSFMGVGLYVCPIGAVADGALRGQLSPLVVEHSALVDLLESLMREADEAEKGALAFKFERDTWVEELKGQARNRDYYRGLIEEALRPEPAAYVCDDGSRASEPLIAKLPEIVAGLRAAVAQRDSALHRLARAASVGVTYGSDPETLVADVMKAAETEASPTTPRDVKVTVSLQAGPVLEALDTLAGTIRAAMSKARVAGVAK